MEFICRLSEFSELLKYLLERVFHGIFTRQKILSRIVKGLYQSSITAAPIRMTVNYEGSHVVYGLMSSQSLVRSATSGLLP